MTSPIAGEREAEAAITPDNPVECTTCGALVVGVAPLSGVAADGRLGVAVSLLTECLGPLEVAAAVIESEDGNEAIETLIAQVRKFCADAKVAALLEPVGEGALHEAWCPAANRRCICGAASPGAATREGAEPVAWRTRYRSEPGMIGHYPWTYTGRKPPERPEYEVEPLFAASPKTNGGMGS